MLLLARGSVELLDERDGATHEIQETLLDGGHVGEGDVAIGPRAQLAGGLGAAEEEHGDESGLFVV